MPGISSRLKTISSVRLISDASFKADNSQQFDWSLKFLDQEIQQNLWSEDIKLYHFIYIWEPAMSSLYFLGHLIWIKHCDLKHKDIGLVVCEVLLSWTLLFLCFGMCSSFFGKRWKSLKRNLQKLFLLYHYPKIVICCVALVFVLTDSLAFPASFAWLVSIYVYVFIVETAFMMLSRIQFIFGAPTHILGALSFLISCFSHENTVFLTRDILLFFSAFAFCGMFYFWRMTVMSSFCLRFKQDRFVSRVREILASRVLEQTKAKSLVFGQLAHDIGTPLSAMSMALELLEEQMMGGQKERQPIQWTNQKQDQEQEEAFEAIHAAVAAITVLRQSMLDYVRKANDVFLKPSLEPVDVEKLVLKKAFILLRQLLRPKKAVKAKCFVDPQLLSVKVLSSESWLLDMLMNFVSNAVKFTEKGEIQLNARIRYQPAHDQDAMTCVVFEVVDSGKGIPTNKGDLMFSPFGQLQDDKGGTGLGLVAVKQKARVLGGDAGYYNNVGKPGATFYFTVPFKAEGLESMPLRIKPLPFGARSHTVDPGIIRSFNERVEQTDSKNPVVRKSFSHNGAFPSTPTAAALPSPQIKEKPGWNTHPRPNWANAVLPIQNAGTARTALVQGKGGDAPETTKADIFADKVHTVTDHSNLEHIASTKEEKGSPSRSSAIEVVRQRIRSASKAKDYDRLLSAGNDSSSDPETPAKTPDVTAPLQNDGVKYPGKSEADLNALIPMQSATKHQSMPAEELHAVITTRRTRLGTHLSSMSKPRKEVTVMVVDDSPILLNLYTRMLHKSNVTHIIHAQSGEECLAKLFSEGQTVADIILMDDRMPGLRGPAVANEIQMRCKNFSIEHPSVYLCTGSCPIQLRATFPDIDRCVRAIIQKPIKKETIKKILKNEISAVDRDSYFESSISEEARPNRSFDRLFDSRRDVAMGQKVFDLDVQTLRGIQWNAERVHVEKELNIL